MSAIGSNKMRRAGARTHGGAEVYDASEAANESSVSGWVGSGGSKADHQLDCLCFD